MVHRVAVIGAGIIGISTAFCIADSVPNTEVTVIAEHFTPNTTSDGAAGICIPYLMGDDAAMDALYFAWAKDTFEYFKKLHSINLASHLGINLVYGHWISTSSEENKLSTWKDIVFGYRPMSAAELDIYKAKRGFFFGTFITECAKFLPFLTKQFQLLGGKQQQRKVEGFKELAGSYDIVVNCTGVWAKHVTNDEKIHPIRGQVLRMAAPWIKTFVMEDEDYYILPNTDTVVVGGTHGKDDWNVMIDSDDRDRMLGRCCQLIPSLRNAPVVREWVGLRPGRSSVRLEYENVKLGNGRSLKVVHNYGHSGSGVTLSWGCAKQAAKLVAECLGVPQRQLQTSRTDGTLVTKL